MLIARRVSTLMCVVIGLVVLLSSTALAVGDSMGWTQRFPSVKPPGGPQWAATHYAIPSPADPDGASVWRWDETSSAGIMYRYSKSQETWVRLTPSATMGFPTPRPYGGACLAWSGTRAADYGTDDTVLFLFGGQKADATFTNEVDLYDVNTNTWIYQDPGGTGNYPTPRANSGCAKIYSPYQGGFVGVLVFGGIDSSGYNGALWTFCDMSYNIGSGLLCGAHPGRFWYLNDQSLIPNPGPRMSMAFMEWFVADQRDGYLTQNYILWGGWNSAGSQNDAYRLMHAACCDTTFYWRNFSPRETGTPSPRYAMGFAYRYVGNTAPSTLPAQAWMVITHGYSSSGQVRDTYVSQWDLNAESVSWQAVSWSTSGPSVRHYPLFACYKPPPGQPWNGCPGSAASPITGYLFYGGYYEARNPISYSDTWTAAYSG